MSGLEEAYAPPASDTEASAEAAEDDESDVALPSHWYAIPLWRLFSFSLLGGNVYQLHYMYRAWKAHRESFGYSAHKRWTERYDATGFRISPFWRAALVLYSYSWLLVVRREARRERLGGFGPPGVWFVLQWVALLVLPAWWNVVALSIVFLPAQLVVNRLHDQAQGTKTREPVTAAELCWLALGMLAAWSALKSRGAW